MKSIILAILLIFVSGATPLAADPFNDYINKAIGDLKEVKKLDPNIQLDDIIQSLEKTTNALERSVPNLNPHSPQAVIHGSNQASLERLVIMTLPASSIIIFLLLVSLINKPRQLNPERIRALQQIKFAVIDFSISDEDFLTLRNNIKKLPIYTD